MDFDRFFKIAQILAWVGAVVVFYFSDASALKEKIAAVNERISVAETKIEQETRGYYVIQSSLGQRLERVEAKIDRLIEARLK